MTSRFRASERSDFIPPKCPRCASSDVEVVWLDDTSYNDDERMYTPGGFNCLTCEAEMVR